MEIVDICPVSEEEWRRAETRKNCAEHANKCSEPDKLVYHCVIDPYVNQLIEVCAYPQNIVLGTIFNYFLLNSYYDIIIKIIKICAFFF